MIYIAHLVTAFTRKSPRRLRATALTVASFVLLSAVMFATNVGDDRTASAQTTHNICERTIQVRDVIIAELGTDPDTSATYSTAATAHTAGGTACDTIFETVTATQLTQLVWPTGTVSNRFLMRNVGLSELKVGDFAGLTNLRSLHIENMFSNSQPSSPNENTITELPEGIFEGVTSLTELTILNVEGFKLKNWWWGTSGSPPTPNQAPINFSFTAKNLVLAGYEIPHDFFDQMVQMRYLDLGQNPISRVNTRWFENVTNFATGLRLNGSQGHGWYYRDGPLGTTAETACADSMTNCDYGNVRNNSSATDLATAIIQAAAADGTTVTTWSGYTAGSPPTATQAFFGGASNSFWPGYNLCAPDERPGLISRELVKAAARVYPARFGDGGNYNFYKSREFGCGPGQSAVVAAPSTSNDMARLVWNRASWQGRPTGVTAANAVGTFDARGSELTELKPLYFKGIDDGRLKVLNLTGNKISEIADSTFANLGIERLYLGSNALGSNPTAASVRLSDWFDDGAAITTAHDCSSLIEVWLNNNGLTRSDIAYDVFDCNWGTGAGTAPLSRLDMSGNPLGMLNTRWFAPLYQLRWGLYLDNSPITHYYHGNHNNEPAANLRTAYWDPYGNNKKRGGTRVTSGPGARYFSTVPSDASGTDISYTVFIAGDIHWAWGNPAQTADEKTAVAARRAAGTLSTGTGDAIWVDIEWAVRIFKELGFTPPARETGQTDEQWAAVLKPWAQDFYWNALADNANPVETTGLLEELRYRTGAWSTIAGVRQEIERNRNTDAFRYRANYFRPPPLGLNICNRPKPIWAEFMREFSFITDEIGANSAQGDWTGDGRHARWAHMSNSDCVVMPARALMKSDQSVIDITADDAPAAFDANLHDLAIYSASRPNIGIELQGSIGVVGSDGALDPDDFANMQYVTRLNLSDMDIKSIPVATFNDLRNLETLTLSGNHLDNVDMSSGFVLPLRSLKNLIVENNFLTEFRSSWLTSGQRDQLEILRYRWNPIRSTDLTGLNLKEVRTSPTQLTRFDPAIYEMSNLEKIWWGGSTMQLSGLHGNGMAGWTQDIGPAVSESNPSDYLGNQNQFEDATIDAEAAAAHWEHFMWQKSRNDADAGNDLVRFVKLTDPCRPSVSSVADPVAWADSEQYGDLCLTEAQKSTFVNSIDSFNALYWPVIFNGGLSSAQMGTFLDGIEGENLFRLDIHSNPAAFGASFDDSKLDAFDNAALERLWHLGITNSGLTYAQANTILRNLAQGAYADSQVFDDDENLVRRSNGLVSLDFSYNIGMFTGVAPSQLSNFLAGVTNVGNWRQNPSFNFAGTDLNFDQLVAIINSMETHTDDESWNAWRVVGLNLSDNPNIWKRWNATTEMWDDVPGGEVSVLMNRFRGLTSLSIGNTGLTSQMFNDVIWGLNARGLTTTVVGPGNEPAIERLTSLSLRGNDMSSFAGLTNRFQFMNPTLPTRRAAFTSLDLSGTGITLTMLDAIADGLQTADALKTLTNLNLCNNPGLFDGADPEDANDPTVVLLKRFVNLRTLSVCGSVGEFSELQAIITALDEADGTDDDMNPMVRTLDISDNPKIFTIKTPSETPGEPDVETRPDSDDIVMTIRTLPNALKRMTNTDLTPSILDAVLRAETEGQTAQRQREIEQAFGAQNPAFGFLTPLPEDMAVESGRGSLRVTFTHDPMRNGEPFTVLRYEYRYRLRPADPTEPWGTTDSETWRTASIDLSETGPKIINLYGLEPETNYQVQLRATSLALPNVATGTGGTWTSLPEINEIRPAITEVSVRAGDTIRLEVNVYGLADVLDNTLPDKENSKLIFSWTEEPTGGEFAAPGDTRRVMYTAPSLPGTYTIMTEAQPDGICEDHHKTTFDISDEDRARCQATFTVRVSRVPAEAGPRPDPINPAGLIPSSLTDNAGIAYAVFTPVDGGTFSGEGITVTAEPGAIPDQQLLGVAASVSPVPVPEPTPGTKLTLSGNFYDVMGVQRSGDAPVSGYNLDDPLSVCLPMPDAFRANISDIVIVNRSAEGSLGILASTLVQSGGSLTVCGKIGQLPATVAVAKMGVVEEPPPPPEGPEPPPTGATAPSNNTATMAFVLGALLLAGAAGVAGVNAIRRRRSRGRGE